MPVITDPAIRTNLLLASIDIIRAKLERTKRYLISTYQQAGRLEPGHQYAVRVIDSRIRELYRQLLIQTRPEADPARQAAFAESRMLRPDNGLLFRWRLQNHGFGRLGCTGCEYDYADSGLAMPQKVVLSKVCPTCGRGVMHSLGVESYPELLEGLEGFWQGVGMPPGPQAAHRVTQLEEQGVLSGTGAMLLACEACGYWEVKQ